MSEKVVLEHDDLRRTLRRIAHEIAEKNPSSEALAVVGIHTRGAILARRLHAVLGELTGAELPIGDLDISFYRDDVAAQSRNLAQPVVHASHVDFDVSERTVHKHLGSVYRKLDAHDRLLAVQRGQLLGLIPAVVGLYLIL